MDNDSNACMLKLARSIPSAILGAVVGAIIVPLTAMAFWDYGVRRLLGVKPIFDLDSRLLFSLMIGGAIICFFLAGSIAARFGGRVVLPDAVGAFAWGMVGGAFALFLCANVHASFASSYGSIKAEGMVLFSYVYFGTIPFTLIGGLIGVAMHRRRKTRHHV